MHDTHDVRKSKELHDKEMNLDQREPEFNERKMLRLLQIAEGKDPDASQALNDFMDHTFKVMDHKFRSELIQLLTRIAKALEQPIQVRKEF